MMIQRDEFNMFSVCLDTMDTEMDTMNTDMEGTLLISECLHRSRPVHTTRSRRVIRAERQVAY